MDDDLGMLGEEAHRPRRAGATHRRQHERLQPRLESGLNRLVPKDNAAQPRSGAIGEHGAKLEIGAWLQADDADPGAKPACPGSRRFRVIASDVGALLIERRLAKHDTTLVNLDLLDGLAVSQNPAGDLDVVDIATADSRSIDCKREDLAGLGRSKFEVVNFN
jgi:hypothetical protein